MILIKIILNKIFLIFLIIFLQKAECYNNILSGIQQLGLTNLLIEKFNTRIPVDNDVYDFIVIGGGSAGCVLANRLSENPNWRIALLEAGGIENIVNKLPSFAAYTSVTSANWNFQSVPQKNSCFGLNGNVSFQPRGKILGGTSSINFMIHNRGNRRDYDGWAKAGNHGWSYRDVLPYFLKSEAARLDGLEHTQYHNVSGPLSVDYVRYRTEIVHAFVKGAQQAGFALTDYSGASQLGVSYVQSTTLKGRRHSAYQAFIKPIMKTRSNLQIFTYARVVKLLIDKPTKSAYGVQFLFRKKLLTFKAKKEVILSAGSFMSPQLLMLAGIGPAVDLQKLGIEVIQNLPVGQRLYDHLSHFGPTFITNTTNQALFPERVTPKEIIGWFAGQDNTRLSTLTGVEALAFLKVPQSKLPKDWPDVEIIFASGSLASDDGTALKKGGNFKDIIYKRLYQPIQKTRQDHFTLLIMPFHPKTIGRLWLRSKDPLIYPVIDPNYFAKSEDVEFMLAGLKAALRITETKAMKEIGTRLLETPLPGCESHKFASDDYWRCSIRSMSYTLHHQVATCRMGPAKDPTTVVSPQLKVHGMRKLRVVDGGIIPTPPTAHTNLQVFMIAEKAADMIRGDWR